MLTGKQIRAARVLADWEINDLADRTGLSFSAIQTAETGVKNPRPSTIEKITKAFDNAGIEFTENEGVRRRPAGIETFEGVDRFEDFANFMYSYLRQHGGEVIICQKDDTQLRKARKDINKHRKIMEDLVANGKVTGRILVAEGTFAKGWAEIRKQKLSPDMPEVTFYTFGDNLALISFDHPNAPYVALHKNTPFAAAYKSAFNAAWEKAEVVE